MKIILEIRFENLIAVVILGLCARLCEVGDVAQQKVRKWVASGIRCCVAEGQNTVGRRVRSGEFVLLRGGEIGTKLQVMSTGDLGNIVPVGVSRIGVIRPVRYIPVILSKSVVNTATQAYPRQHALSVHLREEVPASIGPTLPGIWVWEARAGEDNMIGGVAEDELVQEGGRRGGGKASYERGRRTYEIGLDCGKTCPVCP